MLFKDLETVTQLSARQRTVEQIFYAWQSITLMLDCITCLICLLSLLLCKYLIAALDHKLIRTETQHDGSSGSSISLGQSNAPTYKALYENEVEINRRVFQEMVALEQKLNTTKPEARQNAKEMHITQQETEEVAGGSSQSVCSAFGSDVSMGTDVRTGEQQKHYDDNAVAHTGISVFKQIQPSRPSTPVDSIPIKLPECWPLRSLSSANLRNLSSGKNSASGSDASAKLSIQKMYKPSSPSEQPCYLASPSSLKSPELDTQDTLGSAAISKPSRGHPNTPETVVLKPETAVKKTHTAEIPNWLGRSTETLLAEISQGRAKLRPRTLTR